MVYKTKDLSNFINSLISAAEEPAMLAYLDVEVTVKGEANKNFAQEPMELFPSG
jgi:uncharacterized protein (DUF1800 family)